MQLETMEYLPDLWAEARSLVAQIPEGMVSTFGGVAKALGDVRAARFIGMVVGSSPGAGSWRVVRSDGALGPKSAPAAEIRARSQKLMAEGISVVEGRVANLDRCLFSDFRTCRPLEVLRGSQLEMRKRLAIPSEAIPVERVAGADVAYDGERAWASLAVFDIESKSLIETRCQESSARFPYVPTYLAYRELPVMKPLVSRMGPGTVLMYDGNGILHPEGFGVASHAGVLFGIPTVGVAKTLLCGSIKTSPGLTLREVEVNGRFAGHAVSKGGRSPIFVSPGHGIGHAQALSIVGRFLKHRIPEPIRVAHSLATEERRSASNK